MTTVSAGTSKTFTAQSTGMSFVVSTPGGAVGSVVDQNGATNLINSTGMRRTFGPLGQGQTITVNMQLGNAVVDLLDWDGGAPVTKVTNSTTGLDELSAADKAVMTNSGVVMTIAKRLLDAYNSAKGANPFDLAAMSSPPTITVGPAALANPVQYGYFDTDGYKRLNFYGAPRGDTSNMVLNVSSGYARLQGWLNTGAQTSMSAGQLMTAKVTAQKIQFPVNGLSAGLIRFRVNNQLVSASTTSAGTTNIEVDLGSRQTATVGIEYEQAQSCLGIIVDADDTVWSTANPPEPLVVVSDSYFFGTTAAQGLGGLTLPAALRDISGLNVIPMGVSSTGWVQTTYNMSNTARLDAIVTVVNASGARLAMISLGLNDVLNSVAPANVQATVISALSYLMARTTCKWVVSGSWPANLNRSAALLAMDAAIRAGVNASDTSRAAFMDINGITDLLPWVLGTRTTATGTGVAGNSRYVTGSDGVHLSSTYGTEYMARRITDGLISVCTNKGW